MTHETSELAIKNFGSKGNSLKLKPYALKVRHLKLSFSMQKKKIKTVRDWSLLMPGTRAEGF